MDILIKVFLLSGKKEAVVGGVVLAALFLVPALALAQAPADLNEPHGDHPFGSFQVSDIDRIAFANGALDVEIALLAHAGRGLGHQKFFSYSSKLWTQVNVNPPCDPSVMQCPPPIEPGSFWGHVDFTDQFSATLNSPGACGTSTMQQEW